MLEPKTFAKESKQYQFFRKLWEFGTFEVFIILAAIGLAILWLLCYNKTNICSKKIIIIKGQVFI